MFRLPYVRESKTVLDSGFHVMDSGFQVLDCGFFVSGSWIPDSNGWWDLDSLSCTPDAKAQFSRLHKIPDCTSKNFPDSGIRIPLHREIQSKQKVTSSKLMLETFRFEDEFFRVLSKKKQTPQNSSLYFFQQKSQHCYRY